MKTAVERRSRPAAVPVRRGIMAPRPALAGTRSAQVREARQAAEVVPSAGAEEHELRGMLGAGVPLPEEQRGRLQPALGVDLTSVRLHSGERAARLARGLGARAFTHGRDVVFGADAGLGDSRLLAHELAHVGQQARRSGTPAFQREEDPRVTACLGQTDDILPGRVGLVTHIDRTMQLEEILGPEYAPLETQIRANTDARRFVCEAGVPAIVALWDTRTEQGALDVAAARQSLSSQRERYSRYVMPRRRQERRLQQARAGAAEVGTWAGQETRRAGLASSMLLPTLPAPQRSSLQASITQLRAALPTVEAAGPGFATVDTRLGQLVDQLTNARRALPNEYGVARARIILGEASDNVDEMVRTMHTLQARVDVDALARATESIARDMTGLLNAGDALDQPAIDEVRDRSRSLRTRLRDSRREIDQWPASARRVLFMLRYLMALNDPSFSDAPSADETAAMRNAQALPSDDLNRVFGTGVMSPDMEFIEAASLAIYNQIAVRGVMEQRLNRPTALVPPQGDVEAYFAAMAREPNDAVRVAYTQYAEAYFVHRVVANLADLTAVDVANLYAQPPGAVGMRGLVCSGYALLGAHLMQQAGARLQQYVIAVHASDDQLRANVTLTDVHAIARLSRNGSQFYISNHLVVDREEDGIGPDAVAWENAQNPRYIGRGNTLAVALAAVLRVIQQRTQQLGPAP